MKFRQWPDLVVPRDFDGGTLDPPRWERHWQLVQGHRDGLLTERARPVRLQEVEWVSVALDGVLGGLALVKIVPGGGPLE